MLQRSGTTDALLDCIAKGSVSVAEAHRLARTIKKDGLSQSSLDAFCSLGADGLHSNNLERDLHNWMVQPFGLKLETSFITLKLCEAGYENPQPTDVPILAPHDWLFAAYHSGRWEQSMTGPRGEKAVSDFWEWALEQPWGAMHPVLTRPGLRENVTCTVPLVVHTDGAEAFTDQEALIISMSSLISETSRNVWDSKLVLCMLMERSIHDATVRDAAMQDICSFLAWSIDACMAGIAPSCNYYGEEFLAGSVRADAAGRLLAGGWAACYAGWKGDRKERKNLHHLDRNYLSTKICEYCLAVKPTAKCRCKDLTYADSSPNAMWRMTQLTQADFEHLQSRRSPFAQLPGFHIDTLWEDLMHTVHLGIGKDLVGSLLAEFVLDHPYEPADEVTLATNMQP